MIHAANYLKQNNKPNWTPITRIPDGGETPLFKVRQGYLLTINRNTVAFVKPKLSFGVTKATVRVLSVFTICAGLYF